MMEIKKIILENDYHLKAGSPAIGKGIPISGMDFDFDGVPWKNPPSIGAYEYVATSNILITSITLT